MKENHQTDEGQPETGNHFSELGRILAEHLGFLHPNENPKTMRQVPAPEPSALKILIFLKPVPWILTGLFGLSFFWDFDGIRINLLGLALPFEGLLRIISVSGLIGFLTNWIAITMLFRPLQKRPLLGQGLIPAHKQRIAARLAFAVSDDLINPDLIKKKMGESKAISRYREQVVDHVTEVFLRKEFREDIKNWIVTYISEVIENTSFKHSIAELAANEIEKSLDDNFLEKAALKTYSLLRGRQMNHVIEDAITRLPDSVEQNMHIIEEFLDELPDHINSRANRVDELVTIVLHRLINQLDIQTFVEENLREYDEKRLETMIRNASNEQLKTIQYLGAILGTIGGFVIWQPLLSLGVLSLTFCTVYLLDWWLYQAR